MRDSDRICKWTSNWWIRELRDGERGERMKFLKKMMNKSCDIKFCKIISIASFLQFICWCVCVCMHFSNPFISFSHVFFLLFFFRWTRLRCEAAAAVYYCHRKITPLYFCTYKYVLVCISMLLYVHWNAFSLNLMHSYDSVFLYYFTIFRCCCLRFFFLLQKQKSKYDFFLSWKWT